VKCIRCGQDSKYTERTGGRCPQCTGKFAFEPKSGDKVTDAGFHAAIERVSAGGHIRWGVENLYYEVCRRTKRTGAGVVAIPLLIALAFGIAAVASVVDGKGTLLPILPWVLGICGLLAVIIVIALRIERRTVAVSVPEFDALWRKWQSAHGVPAGLIVRAEPAAQAERAQRPAEPDLGDYSFDRAVICDRARTVDLLLANNFHFENNCAVLSIGGYPSRAFETVRTMLRRNPRIVVFALHDATWEGCMLAHRLATDASWFKGTGRVIDVGLRPRHAKPFRGLWQKAVFETFTGSPLVRGAEARWLERYSLELAAIRPEQIVKRLFRAITNQTALEHPPGESVSVVGGDATLAYDATASDGGDDSFG
jgi:hypothetical protein